MPLVLPPAVDAVLDGLSRWPDVEGDLVAVDAADRLLLAEAAPLIAASRPGEVVVLDDAYGAIALGAIALGARGVRVHTDAVTSERAILANAARVDGADLPRLAPDLRVEPVLTPSVVTGARLVLARLPRALDALAETAALVADHAAPDVTFLATGRLKHMSRSMNDVLAARFDDVRATLAHGKSRALVARSPRPADAGTVPFPRSVHHGDVGLTVVAHGAAFAGTSLDIGTRFLLTFLDDVAADLPEGGTALDLGCGTGLLAAAVARAVPSARVTATDRSAAAVASAGLTARANGVGDRVVVLRDDVAASVPDASVDVVVCNPPFHAGAALSTDIASAMFRAAARVLRPGGVLWTVFNSPLRYRGELGRVVGPTTHAGQNPKFTVTRSVRR
ncbi:methyltransferase [Sanguibacter hominis ATCC BAA-789]|uniref:Methyltransferase n=1 Tax=Sanguibacter hominis ATCC BAA-789 TaxID=1312740 RepID=A0A9X5ISY5_9MICO|nr:methyltransferase [Sanguibacter hominis]NKX93666.1 methyltransferase [Sanguibacter hominis ATCC BAA-789]